MITKDYAMIERLANIERLLIINGKDALTTSECALIMGISPGQVRKMTMNRQLPYYKRGNKNYYSKKEIQEWMLTNKMPSTEEINNIVITQYN